MTRLVVGPFNRVEGDLEVQLEISQGSVVDAYVVSSLYRGFEAMLVDKPAADALVYAPRICGICSVSQSVAAARALAAASGLHMADNAQLAVNLVHAVENLADHLTHFYMFFMPDFARAFYRDRPWYEPVRDRFAAIKGTAAAEFLPARAELMRLMGIVAGKWPHTLSLRPGGTTRPLTRAEIARMGAMLVRFRRFFERVILGDSLEAVTALTSREALLDWALARADRADFARFVQISEALNLGKVGRTEIRHMSYGAYPGANGPLFARGSFAAGLGARLDTTRIAEDVSHAWYADTLNGEPVAPTAATTIPDLTRDDAYSWCKAPRLGGEVIEVGALSRQLVNGHPLLRDIAAKAGASVEARIVARIVEAALLVLAMQEWLERIDPAAPFLSDDRIAQNGTGEGLTEAARGSLGHWLNIVDGRLAGYQIVAPTTWNFSPRDRAGTPGPLEQALRGTPVEQGQGGPVTVQHVVRSFDPCMVCTVH
ncbi:MAG: nickel-dependent hydrogenase large subunit [Erythrobacter sp.]|jgi:hydrogenase large subunit